MKFLWLASIFFVLIAIKPGITEGYRILCVFPLPVKSHYMMFEALMKGLARKGHQVDVVSTLPLKKPYANYTDIIVLPFTSRKFINNVSYDRLKHLMKRLPNYIASELGVKICEYLGHPEMLKLINNPPKDVPYDLVLTQILGANCFIALGHRFNVPVVGVSSSALYPWHHGLVANPANLAFAPNNLMNYVAPMTFWQRLHNTVDAVYNDLAFQYSSRSQDNIIWKYLGDDAPGVREAEKTLALILVNTHPSVNGPIPVTPAIVEVGGLHVQDDNTKLPKDLKDWMDNSTDGFVYFSFGSMLLIETFPRAVIHAIYKSLGKIAPTRVLIKIVNPHLLPPGLPSNFRTIEWAPQYNVLKHKNIKAFITHGGLMGTQEAIHCGVPMIGMPFIADQFVNIDVYLKMKIAVGLNSMDFTEEQMDAALNEILYNPVYKDTMVNVSARFRDRPMNPLDTAIWWVEYVVRHGSYALKSPAMELSWWQIELIDVYAFILLSAAMVVYLTVIVIRFLLKIRFTLNSSKTAHTKKLQ